MSYLVQHYVDLSKKHFPNRVAFSCPGSKVTYETLWSFSNKLANLLLAKNVRRQDRVAIFMKRSTKNILSMIGVLKADAIYISIDRKTPLKRSELILNDCKPSAIICDNTTLEKTVELLGRLQFNPTVMVMNEEHSLNVSTPFNFIFPDQIQAQTNLPPPYKNIDKDIAHIIYTSGSTGSPKGVMISHLNIMNYIDWAVDFFQISSEDVVLGTAPFTFDMSTFDIFAPMKAGAQLCIAPESSLLFPKKLFDLIRLENVTIWKGVSSLLMYIAKTGALKNSDLPTLRKIIFAGEVLPTNYVIEWMKRFPKKEFYNGYGPTEATGVSICYKVDSIPKDAQEIIPIGKARTNLDAFILREDNTRVELGEIGELCIRGSGVASGYWNNPEKTFESFIPNPVTGMQSDRIYRTGDLALLREDGNLEFIDRKDRQVKWMGYRIELGDVENALLSINEVRDAAVILVNEHRFENQKTLVAYAEVEIGTNLSDIMIELRQLLPAYMLPKRIIPLKQLPRSGRGKVDRQNLHEIYKEYVTQTIM